MSLQLGWNGNSHLFSVAPFIIKKQTGNSRQTISYLLFGCTLQDVRIKPLGTDNNTKGGKRQGGINLLFAIDYLVFFQIAAVAFDSFAMTLSR
jgi:hypothetical protein